MSHIKEQLVAESNWAMKLKMEQMKFYRYETTEYAVHDADGELAAPHYPNPKLEMHEYEMKKETPKGYWIGSPWTNDWQRWVSKSTRKRFAFPTQQEALSDYIRRTTHRVEILKRQLTSCQMSLASAKQLQKEKYTL